MAPVVVVVVVVVGKVVRSWYENRYAGRVCSTKHRRLSRKFGRTFYDRSAICLARLLIAERNVTGRTNLSFVRLYTRRVRNPLFDLFYGRATRWGASSASQRLVRASYTGGKIVTRTMRLATLYKY